MESESKGYGNLANALDNAAVFLAGIGLSFHRFPILVKSFFLKHKEAFLTWALLLLVACLIFGWGLLNYGFNYPLSGDNYLQEQTFPYLFYDYWHEFFLTGQLPMWDTASALGTNNFGGNSFYSLFSPFYMIIYILPRSWIPVELGLKYVLQTAFAGFFFSEYLKEFSIPLNGRRLGGLAYAFCGWVIYFMWFEHFLDSYALLPFILWGVEKVLKDKDPRMLSLALCIQGFTNFFFLAQFAIGAFFYAMWRYLVLFPKLSHSDRFLTIGIGFIAFLFGIMGSAFILIPGIENSEAMPRAANADYLQSLIDAWNASDKGTFWTLIFRFDSDGNYFQSLYPVTGFFFMPNADYSSNLLGPSWYDNASGSSFVFTPITLLAFAGVLDGIRRRKWSYPIGFILVAFMMSIPFFYYLFAAFTIAYARFLLAPTAWIITFAVLQTKHIKEMPKYFMDASFAFVIVMQLLVAVYALDMVDTYSSVYDGVSYWQYRYLAVPIEMAYTLVCYLFLRHYMTSEKFSLIAICLVSFEAIAMGNLVSQDHGFGDIDNVEVSGQGLNIIDRETAIVNALDEFDDSQYRIQNSTADRNNPNIQMRIGYSGLSAFNSVYAFNTTDLLNWSKIPYSYGNWSMGAHQRRVNMETFLGVKYYMVPRDDENVPFGYEDVMDIDPTTVLDPTKREALENLQDVIAENYSTDLTDEIARSLYVNTDYVDFAFPFDTVVSSSAFSNLYYEDYNEYAYLRYGIVDSDSIQDVMAEAGDGIDYDNTLNSANTVFATEKNLIFTLSSTDGTNYEGTLGIGEDQGLSYSIDFTKVSNEYGSYDFVNDDYDMNLRFTEDGQYATFNGLGKTDEPGLVTTGSDGTLTITVGNFTPIKKISGKYSTTVTVYSSHWDDNGNYITGGSSLGDYIYPEDTKIDYDSPGSESLYGLKWYSKIVVEKSDGSAFASDATPENPVYLSIRNGESIDWHFIYDYTDPSTGETSEKELPLDGYQSQSTYSSGTAHGFYVTQPIKRIVGILYQTMDSSEKIGRPEIYLQNYDDYRLAVDKLNSEPVEIISQSNDLTDFKTDYGKEKYVVLNQPMENGWSLYEVTDQGEKSVNIYKSQGGFVGFVAPAGEHEYILSYVTPGLKEGIAIGTLGLLGMALSTALYLIITDKKRFLIEAGISLDRDLADATFEEK